MRKYLIAVTVLLAACADESATPHQVVMEPAFTLHFDSLHAPTRSAVVAISTDGQSVAVTPDSESGEIYLFQNGEWEATYEAKGNGPAEIGRIADLLFSSGDSLYVLDSDNSKILLLTPAFQHVRSTSVASGTSRLALADDGALLIAAEKGGSVEISVVNGSGETGAFATVRVEESDVSESALLASSRDGVWVASGAAYQVSLLSSTGSAEKVVERRPEWWDYRPENADRFAAGLGTQSRLLGISGEPNVLWVLAGTPPERYPDADPSELDFSEPSVFDQLGDLVVEAIDVTTGDATGALRIDELGVRLLPGGWAWALEFEPSGETYISIAKLKVPDSDEADLRRQAHAG